MAKPHPHALSMLLPFFSVGPSSETRRSHEQRDVSRSKELINPTEQRDLAPRRGGTGPTRPPWWAKGKGPKSHSELGLGHNSLCCKGPGGAFRV